MEDVLDPVSSTGQALYHEAYDPERPVVCFDETSRQLVEEVGHPSKPSPDGWNAMTPSTSETGPGTGSCSVNRRVGGDMSR